MQITFLGTGTSQGVPVIGCDCEVCQSTDHRDNRQRASILISHLDKNIVVDTGPDFRAQMLSNRVKSLDAVLITHEHNDHIAGLDDLRPFIFRQKREMPIYATYSVNGVLQSRFSYAFSKNPYPGAPRLRSHDIRSGYAFDIEGINILPIEVMHGSLPVLAFRMGSFTYITDANHISDENLELIKGTKTLVINSLHKQKHYSHYNLEEALELINLIRPDRCYLTHISHTMGLTSDWEKSLPSNVLPAIDGLTIDVN